MCYICVDILLRDTTLYAMLCCAKACYVCEEHLTIAQRPLGSIAQDSKAKKSWATNPKSKLTNRH